MSEPKQTYVGAFVSRAKTALAPLAGPLASMRRPIGRFAKARPRMFRGVVALSVLSLSAGIWFWIAWRAAQIPPETLLTDALEAYSERRLAEADHIAEKLRTNSGLADKRLGGPPFIRGAVAAREAGPEDDQGARDHYLVAARFLEEAYDRGFPEGYENEGLFLLGKSLFMIGEYLESRPVLSAALEAYPQRKSELHLLLASAYFKDIESDLVKAQWHIDQYLADPGLDDSARLRGLLHRSRILFRRGDVAACQKTLAEIPESSEIAHAVLTMQGQVLMHEAQRKADEALERDDRQAREASRELYQKAIETFRTALQTEGLDVDTERTAMYLIGRSFIGMGESGAALVQLQRTRRKHYETPQGFAAGFYEAELLAQAQGDDEALIAYRRVLSLMGDPQRFSNLWVSLEELRRGMLRAYDHFQRAEQFQHAVELARSFRPLFDQLRALELEAQARSTWGDTLAARAQRLSPLAAEESRREARGHYRESGALYRRLTRLRVATRHYPDDLWHAAEGYLSAQSYWVARELLDRYLTSELLRRRPRALVAYGEALLALDRPEEALAAFEECLTLYGRDAASFRARLLGSRAHLERGEIELAEKLLVDNLQSDLLTPQSKEWRESLFARGRLLHLDGRYTDALMHLEEAVKRYPDDPDALEASYLIADVNHQLANQLQSELEAETVERARRDKNIQSKKHREQALAQFTEVQETISRNQARRELSSLERNILRNCFFARGAVLIGLGRYSEAIEVYSTATNRYQRAPEGLQAYMQIAYCYRLLNRPADARGTVQQAKVVLKRMEDDGSFVESTNFDRRQWEQLLEWLSSL